MSLHWSSTELLGSRIGVLVAALTVSLPIALVSATAPVVSAAALLGGGGLLVLMLLRPAYLPAAFLLGVVLVPSLSLAGLPFVFGQASWTLLLSGFVVARWGWRLRTLKVPADALTVLIVYVGATVLMVIVGSIGGSLPDDAVGVLRRELSYLSAFLIGFVGTALTRDSRKVSRSVAVPTAFACSTAILFMLHGRGTEVPFVGDVFSDVTILSRWGRRAIYPFIEDSPNVGAVILVLMWAIAGPVLLLVPSARDRLLGIGAALALAPAVLATQSRTGMLSMAAAGTALLVLGAASRHWRAVLVTLAAGSLTTWYLYQQLPDERSITLQATTFVARTEIWRQGWADFASAPLLGRGFGYSAGERYIDSAQLGFQYVSIHNSFLGALIDGGVVGLISTILLPVGVLGLMGLRLLRDEHLKSEGAAILAFLAALVTSMMASASLKSAAVSILFWLLFGVASSLSLRLRRSAQVREPPSAPVILVQGRGAQDALPLPIRRRSTRSA